MNGGTHLTLLALHIGQKKGAAQNINPAYVSGIVQCATKQTQKFGGKFSGTLLFFLLGKFLFFADLLIIVLFPIKCRLPTVPM